LRACANYRPSGVSSPSKAGETLKSRFRDGVIGFLFELPFGLLEYQLEEEIDEHRFSNRELKKMGVERCSREHQKLIEEEKEREEYQRQFDPDDFLTNNSRLQF
jgi:hypothetical protein